MFKNSFIIDAIRTPVGKFTGSMSSVRPDDMAAHVIKSLIERNPNLDTSKIDDVILGNANGAGEENRNVARMAGLLAGLPVTVPGETINRLCSSGLAAVISAARAIAANDGDLFIAGGVESMTRAPFVMAKSNSAFSRDVQVFDTSIGWRFVNPKLKQMYGVDSMGDTAENVAKMYNISRADQDMFAFNSQTKAARALAEGRFAREIAAVPIPQKKGDAIMFAHDEFIRPDTSLEALAKLAPAFRKDGSVTAGNSSGINDGAAAILMASKFAVEEYGLKARGKVISSSVVGVEPRIMGIGPVEAARKALVKAGLAFEDLAVIELNEAFAAQGLACIRQWGLDDNDPRINPNGGAIAIGHPLGMTGARLVITALHELELQDKQFALVTMCIGVGQGYAAIIERI